MDLPESDKEDLEDASNGPFNLTESTYMDDVDLKKLKVFSTLTQCSKHKQQNAAHQGQPPWETNYSIAGYPPPEIKSRAGSGMNLGGELVSGSNQRLNTQSYHHPSSKRYSYQ